jgi:molybdate transport system permease protein
LNREYGDAARSLGCSEWRIFWRVMLPLSWRPILAAAGVAFARVLAEWSIVAAL